MSEKKINPKFRILSALAIIFVVAGHTDFGVFDIAGVFPYYSFHVGVFVFISGYFYKEESENNIKEYIRKKIRNLLVPYYIWNLFYGLFVTVLSGIGFGIGDKISLKTLLLDPFLGGHQYGFNFAAWFVPILFLIEVLNLFMRKLLGILHCNKEFLILFATLTMGVMVVWLAKRGSVWGYYKHIGCLLFLFPIFQMGQFYKKKLEQKIEAIPYKWYFLGVLFVQAIILIITKGQIGYSAVWCTGFASFIWVPHITTFTGIAFWLGIARLLEPLWKQGNLLDEIGKNTFSIMMHHILGFWVVSTIFYFMSEIGNVIVDFNENLYFTSYEYRYLILEMESGKWIYLLGGIVIPLLIHKIEQRIQIYRSKK